MTEIINMDSLWKNQTWIGKTTVYSTKKNLMIRQIKLETEFPPIPPLNCFLCM